MACEKSTLGLTEIIARASLYLYTTQHVLKRAADALDLPVSGSQGVHRTFNLRQAVRLALATKLTMAGVNVKHVPAIIDLCEQRVGASRSDRQLQQSIYQNNPGNPWILEILEDDLVKLCLTQSSRTLDHADPASYYSLSKQKIINDFDHQTLLMQQMQAISVHRINVTLLERVLLS